MCEVFILRYTDKHSIGGDSLNDMAVGRRAKMIGFGESNMMYRGLAVPGNIAIVIPQIHRLRENPLADVFFITSTTGQNVWNATSKEFIGRESYFWGQIELTPEEIDKIAEGRSYPSKEIANTIYQRFKKLQ